MQRKDLRMFMNVARLWAVVLAANLIGALLIGLVVMRTNVFEQSIRHEFSALAHLAIAPGFGTVLIRGIFAGWLIALIVWMLPYAESMHLLLIVGITWLVGIGSFSHIIAGAVEVFSLAWADEKSWLSVIGGFIVPALIGNIIGGVTLVAALNHAQVVAKKGR
jgi:formate-nitrite transporter family protein